MKQYLAGTAVKLPIEFLDDDGNEIEAVSATYRVVDESGSEIVPSTAMDLSGELTLTIPAEFNTLPEINLDSLTSYSKNKVSIEGARTVEFSIEATDGNTIPQDLTYVLFPRQRLLVGLNSFQNLAQASIIASTMHDSEAFSEASSAQRAAAMITARERIAKLSFVEISSGQSYMTEGRSIDLDDMAPSAFPLLSERFKLALKKAQVAEANAILGGGDVIEQMRQAGLTSQTIGETHETYRAGAPPATFVSKAALMYLSEFINSSKKITRT